MPITAAQRNRLPASAFAYPGARKYPVPTRAQAKRAGISERSRLGLHRAALSYSAQSRTMGSYGKVAAVVRKRSNVATGRTRATPRRRSAGTVRRAAPRSRR